MKRNTFYPFFLCILGGLLALAACTPIVAPNPAPADEPEAEVIPSDVTVISDEALMNATYSGIYDEPVTLSAGQYEGDPFEAGGASRPTVTYLDHSAQFGDLNGDGVDDVVVFLVENSGGTGNFVYVAAQLNQDGQLVDAGAVLIEDRIQVKSAMIEDGTVALEIITQGPGDGACCPSHKTNKRYTLQDGRLAEVAVEAGGLVKVSAADLDGTEWKLIEINRGEAPVADSDVTIRFDGDQISGFSGCNNYKSGFTLSDENPFVMTVGLIASTRMACPEPILNQETAFFSALSSTSQWGYWIGDLALYYLDANGEFGRLLFTPAVAAAAAGQDDLTANTWQWVSFSSPVEEYAIETPASYTVAFNADGTVNIKADCNQARGSYSTEDGALQVEVGPMTRALCPPESRSDQFVKYLGAAARYFFEDGNLLVDLFADGGTMTFAPTPGENEATATDSGDSQPGMQSDLTATLGNLTYTGIVPDQPITLTDGVGNYTEDGPGTPYVSFMDQLVATGDLNGDGDEDAVVLLTDHSVGSGTFSFLAAVLNVANDPTPSTALMIGDRIQVKALTIAGDQVVAELIAQGGSDPACCPTWNVRKHFALQDGILAEISSEEMSQVTLADLNGTSWQLVDLGAGQEALLPDVEVTLAIDDGQVSGSAGCNNYTGSVTSGGDLPQTFQVGLIAATQMLCPEPISTQETTYLTLLQSVVGWRYEAGNLALAYPTADGEYAYLQFARQ